MKIRGRIFMVIIIRRKIFFLFLIFVILTSIALCFNDHILLHTFHVRYLNTVLIDPGHGGIDGGAISQNGVKESNINLDIALKLRAIFEENGWQVIMTRDNDKSLFTEEGSIRSKKIQDLVNRKKMIDEENPDYVIMIHLNSFPDSSCFGAQTFYPGKSDESKLLAEEIQKQLIEGIDNGNHRKSKQKNDILLLKNITVPTALVECGFLSNPEEERQLQQDQYQNILAQCIYKGLVSYCNLTNNPPKKGIEYIVNK